MPRDRALAADQTTGRHRPALPAVPSDRPRTRMSAPGPLRGRRGPGYLRGYIGRHCGDRHPPSGPTRPSYCGDRPHCGYRFARHRGDRNPRRGDRQHLTRRVSLQRRHDHPGQRHALTCSPGLRRDPHLIRHAHITVRRRQPAPPWGQAHTSAHSVKTGIATRPPLVGLLAWLVGVWLVVRVFVLVVAC